MNLSRVISSLIKQEGLYGITLPFKDEITGKSIPVTTVIQENIADTTIPIFSEYSPWIRECDSYVSDLKCVDKRNSIYLLPPFLTLTPIKYIIDVRLPVVNTRGTYGDIAPAYGINRSVQGVATSQAYMMLAGQMRAEPTFKDLGNNKVQLFGFPKTILTFSVACEHESNGESIPNSCLQSFMKLAQLDLEVFLYSSLQNYPTIPTAHGDIKLPIERWEGAKAAREELLKEWDEVFHLDMDIAKFM